MQKDIKPSKELQEIEQEEVTAEPARLLSDLDLTDPRTQAFLAKMARRPAPEPSINPARPSSNSKSSSPGKPSQSFDPAEMRKALAEETGLSEQDLQKLAPGFLD